MTRKTRWMLAAFGLAFVVASSVAWTTLASDSPDEHLALETIGTGDIEKVVLVTGVLKPAVQVNVGAQVNGQLRKLYVRQGDKVKKGNCWRRSTRPFRSLILTTPTRNLPAPKRKSCRRRRPCYVIARSLTVSG